jgi:hypothetical protein
MNLSSTTSNLKKNIEPILNKGTLFIKNIQSSDILQKGMELLKNKYILYFVIFVTFVRIGTYLMVNRLNAIIYFSLICLIAYQFSKNMVVVLLISLLLTNIFAGKESFTPLREGLENKDKDSETNEQTTKNKETMEKYTDVHPEIKGAVDMLNKTENVKATKEYMKKNNTTNKTEALTNPYDINNPKINNTVDTSSSPEGAGDQITKNSKSGVKSEHFGPRLDYASTLEQSYQNLDELLGSDSIKQLTSDTKTLMQQQQNLFDTMKQMIPVLDGAQNMLKGFNIGDITSSLNNITQQKYK